MTYNARAASLIGVGTMASVKGLAKSIRAHKRPVGLGVVVTVLVARAIGRWRSSRGGRAWVSGLRWEIAE